MLIMVWLQVRVLPGPPMISMGCGVRPGAGRSGQRNGQFFPRPVADEVRRRSQVIGVVMAVNAAQHFDAHAQKSRRNVGEDNVAGRNKILHTLAETVLSQ